MNWLEVTVNTHSESVEVVSSIFIELGSKGESLIDDPQDYYQLTGWTIRMVESATKDLYETDTVIVKGYSNQVNGQKKPKSVRRAIKRAWKLRSRNRT